MMYDWAKYFYFTDILYNGPPPNIDDETLSRNIVSRAYYAAHNIARIKEI